MEPRIEYATTADGVNIAFWTLGEGMPYVQMPNTPFSHIQLEWRDANQRRVYKRLAKQKKLVRYDGRGSGLSDRNVADYSVDAHMLDLDAVVECLGLQRFVLGGPVAAAPIAVAYAARHPEAVSQLVLWCPLLRQEAHAQALRALRFGDWQRYTDTLAHAAFAWAAGEETHPFAAYLRECVTEQAARATYKVLADFNITALLSQVTSPTLILHRPRVGLLSEEVAKRLASRFPDARLVLLEGASVAVWLGDTEAAMAAIDEFLGVARARRSHRRAARAS